MFQKKDLVYTALKLAVIGGGEDERSVHRDCILTNHSITCSDFVLNNNKQKIISPSDLTSNVRDKETVIRSTK